VTPAELCCEYAVDPLGIDVAAPRFSWILGAAQRGQVQSAYRILVASSEDLLRNGVGDKWDSGVVASDASVNVAYAGSALSSGERCCWRVRAWDGDGAGSVWSDPAVFEMGLLAPGDWGGTWIGAGGDLAKLPAPLLRKEFTLAEPVGDARLFLCGLGLYELSINGERVGDRALDPALTDYRERVPYVTHDVTRYLQRGRNAIGVMLGGGWYRGLTRDRFRFSDTLKLLLQLNVTGAGGTRSSVVSDSSWQVGRGPIVHNSLQEGEVYDARLEVPGWDTPGFDASGWSAVREVEPPGGTLFSQLMPPMRVIETRAPKRLTAPRPDTYLYDFGQLFGGWIRIRLRGPAGTRVVIKHSSRLRADGTIDDAAYPGSHESDTYVLRGDPAGETYEPRFTFHPVHYVQITGLAQAPELADVEGRVVHTAVDPSGEFACSNELLNRIHRTVTWTMRNALKGFPMDCLHREPLGYNEPASVSSLLYTRRHMPLFWSKWIDDIKAAQRADGSLSDWAPKLPGSNREHDAAQAGNYPPLVWYLYQYHDDERILTEHYPVMRAYVDYLSTIAEDGLITTGWLGDHMLPGPAPGWEEYVAEETPPPLLWTGYYYRAAAVVARAAQALSHHADAERYGALAEAIRDRVNDAFFDPASANYAAGSQTANGFALALDIVPEGRRVDVLGNLRRAIMETHGGHIHTGHCGTTSVIEALTRYGGADGAETLFALATATTYPGWGYMVAQGATTIWECWGQDWAPGHKPRATSHRADSMMMWGCIDKFFYHCLAGLDEPGFHGSHAIGHGFHEFRIAPQVAGDVTWARASIKTVRGTVASSWKRTGGALELAVQIPVNSRATVAIPKMGRDAVSVSEQGVELIRNGEPAGTTAGLLGAREDAEQVKLRVGSGSYSFLLTAC
jgi:alpha-L-rhamnosidase